MSILSGVYGRVAEFRRDPLPPAGGLSRVLSGEPGERITARLVARLEVTADEGRRVGFVEAEARNQRTLPSGTSEAARRGAAAEVVRLAMDQLNVEFEFHIRRALRDWLLEGPNPATAPVPLEREELSRSGRT